MTLIRKLSVNISFVVNIYKYSNNYNILTVYLEMINMFLRVT